MQTAVSILGETGRIAARLKQYEHRPEQLEMAESVVRALDEKSHLLVEAGTGVGKSFAYLVPAILAATAKKPEKDAAKKPLIVSTNTISLQEQLIVRDIPFLNAVLPVEFSAVLVKGRSNYMSLRRMKGAVERTQSLFSQHEELTHLQSVLNWSRNTTDGSRSDLEFQPLPSVWDEVQSEHGNCLGKKCPTYNQCFYYKARRRVWNADLLVVNHALFFSDLALRREGARILPDYDIVILDEAHTIEAVAGDHLGIGVSSGQIEYLLSRLFNDRSNCGLLVHHGLDTCQQMTAEIRYRQSEFFDLLRNQAEVDLPKNGRVRSPIPIANTLSEPLRQLSAEIRENAAKIKKDEDRIELTAAAERCTSLANSLANWLRQSLEDSVYWIETGGRRRLRTKLVCVPIEVGPVLRNELFNQVDSVILTSATLAVGGDNFDFIKNRIGLTKTQELKLGSPFDYRKQVKLVLPDGIPDPATQPKEFESAVCDRIQEYVPDSDGGTFVLFTSYSMMKNCAARLADWLAEENLAFFCQAEGMPRSLMLERFRNESRAILFGTDSFWQGVDVPGDALKNVIIVKLPFSVPDNPLLEARLEQIKSRGGNPFMHYQLPEAVIKLKQGFGRLIRAKTDSGQIVILDPRIKSKYYGRLFLNSLPECDLVLDEE